MNKTFGEDIAFGIGVHHWYYQLIFTIGQCKFGSGGGVNWTNSLIIDTITGQSDHFARYIDVVVSSNNTNGLSEPCVSGLFQQFCFHNVATQRINSQFQYIRTQG